MHTSRGKWHFTALFSNTARAHELRKVQDWVVIYFHSDSGGEAQRTIVTETRVRSDIPTVIDVVINRDTTMPVIGTWQMPPIPEVQPTFGKRKVR